MERLVTPQTIRWCLLLPLAAFVPLLWYMVVTGGFLPYTAILVLTLRNLSDQGIVLINLVHLIVYGAFLYFVASLIARGICKFQERSRFVLLASIVLLLVVVGLLPIYGAGHGRYEPRNAFQLYGSSLR